MDVQSTAFCTLWHSLPGTLMHPHCKIYKVYLMKFIYIKVYMHKKFLNNHKNSHKVMYIWINLAKNNEHSIVEILARIAKN